MQSTGTLFTSAPSTIMGLPVIPADEPLLAAKFKPLGHRSVSEILDMIQSNVFREDEAFRDTDLIRFLMNEGLGEATDGLIIDESLCVPALPARPFEFHPRNIW